MEKNKIKATIIADSIDPRGNRITSYILTFPRFILPELLTHRMFSRNSASCLTGDTIVYINKPSNLKDGLLSNQPMRLDDIVNKWFNGDSKGRSMKHRLKQLNIRHLNEDTGEYDSISLVDCFKQGKQDVYEIELEDGKKLKCTDNHRILSEDGWIKLSDFNLKYNGKFCNYRPIPKIATNGTTFDLQIFIDGKSQGKTLREICKEHGYNEKCASAFCNKNGVSFSRKILILDEKFDYLNKEWLISKKELGLTNSRIAELCGTTEDRVKKSCKRLGVSGYIGTILKGNNRRISWNKDKTYSLPDESLVNVRKAAKLRSKRNSYKEYKNFNASVTRFLNENRQNLFSNSSYKCAISGSKNKLELHHIDPIWNNKDKAFDLDNIIVLNSNVHRFIHSNNLDIEFLKYYNSGKDLSKFIDNYKDLKLLCDDINKPKSTGNKMVVRYIEVKNITYVGIRETYDIEVEGPHHNFVANGIVVHNSRAIPFEKMVKMVKEDPFIPIAWQFNHKGMQGTEYVTDETDYGGIKARNKSWLLARDKAVEQAEDLYSMDTTKQLCNRLLEPFMRHTTLVTATSYDNFFELRCPKYGGMDAKNKEIYFRSKKDAIKHLNEIGVNTSNLNINNTLDWLEVNKSQAEIHIQTLAESMWNSLNESEPKKLSGGQWHIPFGDRFDWNEVTKIIDQSKESLEFTPIKIAVARAARLSYNTHDGEIDYTKDIKLHNQLLESRHMSPFEHCAKVATEDEYYNACISKLDESEDLKYRDEYGWFNNFRGFIPYRYLVENNLL